MTEEVETYIKRTGQTEDEVFAATAFFGTKRIIELVEQANEKGKKLIYFYASDSDREKDLLSYKFE